MKRFSPTALMLGNFVTGTSVLAPAGMLGELSSGLGVTIRDAGMLVTFGAVMLCFASPLTAWLTSRIDRRVLLAVALAVMAVANLASAFAPDYATLLALRLVMLAVGALYTPQAAGTVGLIVAPEHRGSTISYVFLGWSLAAAMGLPLVTFIASHFGWQWAFGAVGGIAVISLLLLVWRLPAGLTGTPVDLKTWRDVGRNPLILMLLLITTLQMSGQLTIFTYLGPLLSGLTGAGPNIVALAFAVYGVTGFIGNIVASRIVDRFGALKTSIAAMVSMLVGVSIWTLGSGSLAVMIVGVGFWGLAFAAANSMQQVRLVAAAPDLASASVSLNTSALYVGQGLGSLIGGIMFAREMFGAMGYVAVGLIALSLLTIIGTGRMSSAKA